MLEERSSRHVSRCPQLSMRQVSRSIGNGDCDFRISICRFQFVRCIYEEFEQSYTPSDSCEVNPGNSMNPHLTQSRALVSRLSSSEFPYKSRTLFWPLIVRSICESKTTASTHDIIQAKSLFRDSHAAPSVTISAIRQYLRSHPGQFPRVGQRPRGSEYEQSCQGGRSRFAELSNDASYSHYNKSLL